MDKRMATELVGHKFRTKLRWKCTYFSPVSQNTSKVSHCLMQNGVNPMMLCGEDGSKFQDLWPGRAKSCYYQPRDGKSALFCVT